MSQFSERDLAGVVEEALAADRAVPPEWREAARGAFAWRTIDEELIALTFDSHLQAGAAVRGEDDLRTLEFSAEGFTLEVELTGRRIMGQLATAVAGETLLELADGRTRSIVPDESGFFSLDDVDPGPVRFAVRTGEVRLVTEWVSL